MENLETKIYDLENEIEALESKIEDFELDPYDLEDIYCEALDCEGPVNVCGMEFNASDILREMDPTAYRCGLVDFVDGMDKTEAEEYQEMVEQLEEMKEELEDLENEFEGEE